MTIRLGALLVLIFGFAAGACGDGAIGSGDVDARGEDPDDPEGPDASECEPETCEERGWACGKFVTCDEEVVDCADEGFTCGEGERCEGGIDGPTQCVEDPGDDCEVCDAIPDCTNEEQPTRISGRVVTPGRDASDTGNHVGVPNAVVYILRTASADDLPDIPTGLPDGGKNCDRCEDQLELRGPVLNTTRTDATGRWELEGNVPVGEEIILVTSAGKFRRAEAVTIPDAGACEDTELAESVADNPTRLPRDTDDGLAVHLPHIAVTTGVIDAMECVFEKLGIDHDEFDNPGTDARVHLYRGLGEDDDGDEVEGGMRIDDDTPVDRELYSDLSRIENYDMLVADCKGQRWDSEFDDRDAYGENVREYVNRGGRLFASHLSFSWLHDNGGASFDPDDPVSTGLGEAATFQETAVSGGQTGTGVVALDREQASPRVGSFRDWMSAEGVAQSPDYEFEIRHPRSQAQSLASDSEEFVYCSGGDCEHETQHFAFDTPYAAPEDDACGRVAYSGFHVSPAEEGAGSFPFKDEIFPDPCGDDLTEQEKVLLYALFDLNACIGDPVPPPTPCNPRTCEEECGLLPDGCGGLLDCECPVIE